MDYRLLFTTVKNYVQNDFPDVVFTGSSFGPGAVLETITSTTQVNTFITQAEKRIYNSVQIPALRKNMKSTISMYDPTYNPTGMYINLPDDFLSVFSIAIIDTVEYRYEYLLNKDVNYIRQAFPVISETGRPTHYAIFGPTTLSGLITTELSILLGPTPDQAYELELHYYYYPQSITESSNTWLSDNYDPVLLYGTLVEAYTYMKGDADLIAQYEKKYQEALSQLKRLGDGLQRADAYRSGQARVQVT